MNKGRKSVSKIAKLRNAKNEHEFISMLLGNSDNLDKAVRYWFGKKPPKSKKAKRSTDNTNPYLKHIVSYVDQAISMYAKIVPHKTIEKIVLSFNSEFDPQAGAEPKIDIKFDTAVCHIDISELGDSQLDLDKELKKGVTALSDIAWYEYRPCVTTDVFTSDMEYVCAQLRRLYRGAEVIAKIE